MGLGVTIVRNLGDNGGCVAGRTESEFDTIFNWSKDAIRCIHRDFTPVGNVGTGVDDLMSFTLPAGTLATNGDYLTVDYGGLFNNNDDDKRVLALFDGTAYEDSGGLLRDFDGGANSAWRFLNRIIRVSSTQVRVFSLLTAQFILMDSAGTVTAPASAGYIQFNRDVLITLGGGANLNANSVVMKCQGESATATNDNVVQHMSIIELSQQ
jgi:hypothetical protein